MPALTSAQKDWCIQQLQDQLNGPVQIQNIAPLRVEASHRVFYRLNTNAGNLVFMSSPPALENNQAFLAIASTFHQAGIPVPEILGRDLDRGWVLMTDLGTIHLADVYGTEQEQEAIEAAVAQLIPLSQIQGLPVYTAQRMHDELNIFAEWFVAGLLNQRRSTDLTASMNLLVEATQVQPQCCIHRDYHCRNLLFSTNHLGIVDFQDALQGPVLYDIASLLRDCYHEFSESFIRRWLDDYHRRQPLLADTASAQVWDWFNFTAIQRQLKAVGIFARLHLRDAKSSHLSHIIPVLTRLEHLLGKYPDLKPLHLAILQYLGEAGGLHVLRSSNPGTN